MNERKSQASADVVISFMMINTDGTPATGLTLGNLFSAIIKPDGTALAGYTEATFTEPGSDGTYIAVFPTAAANKAFTLVDQDAPYTVTFNSSDVDIPVPRDINIVSVLLIGNTIIEGTLTLTQVLRLLLAVLTGKASGAGTADIKYRDVGDTKDRVELTADVNGNRTASTLDGS